MGLEELTEIAVLEVLHDHAEGLLAAAGAQHPGDVAVLEGRQDPHVPLEIQPAGQSR